MFQLGNDGSLTQADTHRYLLYTLKVSELAAVYTWRSMLLYDRAYRRAQAQEGFSWGADSPHLDRIHLLHRDHPSNALKTSHAPSTKSTAQTPGSSGEICVTTSVMLAGLGQHAFISTYAVCRHAVQSIPLVVIWGRIS